MKKTRQKLTLKTETVRLLSDGALRSIRGGVGINTWCPTSVQNETCSSATTDSIPCVPLANP